MCRCQITVSASAYASAVPKLWVETIEAHRQTVHDAVLDTTAALVTRSGLASVTMSQIAEKTGIGRATLYKYFPDVDAILMAWHDRQVGQHLEQLQQVRDGSADPGEQLEDVLEAYALIAHERSKHAGHGGDIAALVHRSEHLAGVQLHLHELFRDMLARAARAGAVRKDVPPDELARYCVHALAAASSLPGKAAVGRLVALTLAGLRPAHR